MICERCQGTEFRLSGLRIGDVPRLLVLRFPMRCRSCHRRTHGSWRLALVLLQLRRYHLGKKDQA